MASAMLGLTLLLTGTFAAAQSQEVFSHEAPLWPKAEPHNAVLPVVVAVTGATTVRVLVHRAPHGIRAIALTRHGDKFGGEIPIEPGENPWLRYRFQATGARDEIFESPVYTVWRPMTDPIVTELQERARALDLRVRILTEHLQVADAPPASRTPARRASLASARLKLIELLRGLRRRTGAKSRATASLENPPLENTR